MVFSSLFFPLLKLIAQYVLECVFISLHLCFGQVPAKQAQRNVHSTYAARVARVRNEASRSPHSGNQYFGMQRYIKRVKRSLQIKIKSNDGVCLGNIFISFLHFSALKKYLKADHFVQCYLIEHRAIA